MRSNEGSHQFVVIALFEPIAPGFACSRKGWPAHVTLVSNFVADVSGDVLARAVHDVVCAEGPLEAQLAGEALFGPGQDIPVQLVKSEQIVAVHQRLASLVEGIPGFVAVEPRNWRAGYRPHSTHVPGVVLNEGDSHVLSCIATAELTQETATVIAVTDVVSRSIEIAP